MTDARPKGDLAGSAMTKGRIGITPNRSATVAALLSFGLTGLHRLRRSGARRLRARDIPALLERQDILVLDTETTGIGPYAEAIEIVAIDTTGALRLSALSTPVGRISRRSCEMHGLGKDLLHAMGAQPWPELPAEVLSVLHNAGQVLAWRADCDARFLEQTAARHGLVVPPVQWADVHPAYVDARPGGAHGLAAAMGRETLEWVGEHHRAEADCRAVLGVIRAIAR